MSDIHHFRINVAVEVGVNAAIIFEQFYWWIEKNKANERHYHDGRYWTYNSVSAFKKMYPYMSEKGIRTAIGKLVDGGYVVVGDYNKDRYKRPKWYSITDAGYMLMRREDVGEKPKRQNDVPKTAERRTQNGNTHIVSSSYSFTSSSYINEELPNRETKPDSFESDLKAIIDYFNERCGTRYTYRNKAVNGMIHARLSEGFTVDDFKTVIDTKAAKWENDPKMRDYLRPKTLFSASNFESYLNEQAQPKSRLDEIDWSLYEIPDWTADK